MKKNHLLIIYFFSVMMALLPFASFGVEDYQKEVAATVQQLLDPDEWFRIFKQNITIPLAPDQEVIIPTPEETLRQSAPQLQELNRGVKEETGVDLAKFIGWSAKVFKVFFQVIVDLLENVSKALETPNP